MAWAEQRRLSYATGVLVILVLLIGVPVYLFVSDAPTCSDGERNGDEQGVDCGGACEALCATQTAAPTILWSRSFKVTDGVYNAIAYVENPNFDGGVRELAYRFRLYDDEGLSIKDRLGTTHLPPRGVTAIFEPSITTGERIPTRTRFDIIDQDNLFFERMEDLQQRISVVERTLTAPDTSPRLSATLENTSVLSIENVEVVATIFDRAGNAMAASRSVVEELPGSAREELVFTWLEPLPREAARIDILPRIPPNE